MNSQKSEYSVISFHVALIVLFICVAGITSETIQYSAHVKTLELNHNKTFVIDSMKSVYRYDEERYKNENFRLRQIIRNHPGIDD